MQIFRDLAGYSLGRADIVRRAMGKKKIDVMNKEREIFVNGAKKNSIDEVSANKIFDEMAEFAKYAFNKSHAAAYAVVAYQTAFLKCHYTKEFMVATMNSMIGNLNKISVYIQECKELEVEVLKPNINESYLKFSVINGKIRFALSSIKNVGENAIIEIIKDRKENGAFKSFTEFCERVSSESVNKKCIESLIKAGCFDELEPEYTRFDLLDNFETIVDGVNQTKKNNYKNQMNFFDVSENVEISSISITRSPKKPTKKELLDMEKEMLGLYVTGHPLDEYSEYIKNNSTVTSQELNEEESDDETDEEYKNNYDGKTVSFCGILSHLKIFTTKNNMQMLFAQIDDMYGSVELIFFPAVFQRFSNILVNDSVIKVVGKVSVKENEKTKILVNDVSKISKQSKIYIRIPKDKLELEPRVIEYIKKLDKDDFGNNPVYIFLEGTNRVKLLNKNMWLSNNDSTREKLELAFGKENVRIK